VAANDVIATSDTERALAGIDVRHDRCDEYASETPGGPKAELPSPTI
jgi:hypothetical protein